MSRKLLDRFLGEAALAGVTHLHVKSDAGIEHKEFDFEVKSTDPSGTFTGYGSVFGNVDQGSDIVQKGAFKESIKEREGKGRKLPILWQHRSGEPIGVYTSVKEDDRGLLLSGQLLVDDVVRAKEAYALMKAGAVTGLSIGYRVRDYKVDNDTGIRTLTKLTLEETSVVTFPMNDEARVDNVKASISEALTKGSLPTIREFEEFLRDAGFSKTQATAIAGHGLRQLRRDSEDEGKAAEVLTLLGDFQVHDYFGTAR